jgi:hypothetical protein
MGTACAWPMARWARGTFRSSVALILTPHRVLHRYGGGEEYDDPARKGQIWMEQRPLSHSAAHWPRAGISPEYIPAVTHCVIRVVIVTTVTSSYSVTAVTVSDCRDSSESQGLRDSSRALQRQQGRPSLTRVRQRVQTMCGGMP